MPESPKQLIIIGLDPDVDPEQFEHFTETANRILGNPDRQILLVAGFNGNVAVIGPDGSVDHGEPFDQEDTTSFSSSYPPALTLDATECASLREAPDPALTRAILAALTPYGDKGLPGNVLMSMVVGERADVLHAIDTAVYDDLIQWVPGDDPQWTPFLSVSRNLRVIHPAGQEQDAAWTI